MGLLKKESQTVDPALLQEVRDLSVQIAALNGEYEGMKEALDLSGEITDLKTAKVDLELELALVREEHDRENREIEHKIGLHKKQVEHEIKAAKKDAELAVKEKAMVEQEKQFEKHMTFQRERFEDEIKAHRVIMEQVLERLPKFERSYSTVEHIGTPPSNDGKVTLALEASGS